MNISFIHIFEIITLCLIAGKLFQIRRLYSQAFLNSTQAQKTNSKKLSKQNRSNKASSNSSRGLYESTIYQKFKENHSFHNLPLPEVSFTEGLPLPEVSFSSNDEGFKFSNKPQSKHKAILNDYIEDFFFESPHIFHEAEVVQFEHYKLDSNAEDEFITVEDEHAEVIRAFESLEKNVCFVR